MKVSYKLILWFWWEWLSILKVSIIASLLCPYNISRKKIEIRLVFLHVEKHQSFLQVDFNGLGIKVSYKVIPSFLIGMIKHSQSTQSKKFVISLQYLKKEVRDGIHFFQVDKHQSWHYCFWWKWQGMSKVPKI